jgi:hypothetical protein
MDGTGWRDACREILPVMQAASPVCHVTIEGMARYTVRRRLENRLGGGTLHSVAALDATGHRTSACRRKIHTNQTKPVRLTIAYLGMCRIRAYAALRYARAYDHPAV